MNTKTIDKEKKIKLLADIIYDAVKYGNSLPYDIKGEYCAMSIAREHIDELLSDKH